MPVPDFSPGEVLTAAAMDSIGLWLVKTQTIGSGVASVSVPDAFPSDYTNFRVVIDGAVCTISDTTVSIRPGGDTTAASYFASGFFVLYSGTGNGWLANNGTTDGISVGITSTTDMSFAFDVFNPNVAKWTRAMGVWSGDSYVGQYSGVHKVAAAYTSFDLRVYAGTMTGGTIRVYGYRK
jgi:hypothetical protein